MTDDMIDTTLVRLETAACALKIMGDAITPYNEASGLVQAQPYNTLRERALAVGTLMDGIYADLKDRALELARQVGWQIATYTIAPVAKNSGDVAIEWLTGNSYVPPLRSLDECERVWQIDADGALWEAMTEAIESRLIELRVEMAAPEYDNALYVVDLERFEYDEDADNGDDLASGWKPR